MALVSGSLQSLVKIAEQLVGIDWFGQEGNRSGLHGAYPHVFIRKARDENNREAMTSGDQQVLQVNRKLELGWVLDRKVGRLLALEDAIDVTGGAAYGSMKSGRGGRREPSKSAFL